MANTSSSHPSAFDLLVIGAGRSGLAAVKEAKRHGASVALVSRGPLGGRGLNQVNIPQAILGGIGRKQRLARSVFKHFDVPLHPELLPELKEAQKLIRRGRRHLSQWSQSGYLRNTIGVDELIEGEARFENRFQVTVNGKVLSAKKILLCPGTDPIIPDIKGLERLPYWTPETVWRQLKLPEHLCVFGTGSQAVELAQAFNDLGSRVVLVGSDRTLCPWMSFEESERFRAYLESTGLNFILNAKPIKAYQHERKFALRVEPHEGDEKPLEVWAEALLVVPGRHPSYQALDLAKAGLMAPKPKGYRVDDYCRTQQGHIYAAGSCTNSDRESFLNHWQARQAVRHALGVSKAQAAVHIAYHHCLARPEYAQAGLTLDEAIEQYDEVLQLGTSLDQVERYVCLNEMDGYAELLVLPSGVIVGASMMGEAAIEVIQPIKQAIEKKTCLRHFIDSPLIPGLSRSVVWEVLAERFLTECEPKPSTWTRVLKSMPALIKK